MNKSAKHKTARTFELVKPDDTITPLPEPIQELLPDMLSEKVSGAPGVELEKVSRAQADAEPEKVSQASATSDTNPPKRRRGRPKGTTKAELEKRKSLQIIPTAKAIKKTTSLYLEVFSQMTIEEIVEYKTTAKRLTTAEQIAIDIMIGAANHEQRDLDRYLKYTEREQTKLLASTQPKASTFFADVIEGIEIPPQSDKSASA